MQTQRPALEVVNGSSGPVTLRDLMLEADLAVSAGEQALHELLAVGCPTVAVQTASNQAGQLRALVVGSFVCGGGAAGDDDVLANIGKALASVFSDWEKRRGFAARGQRLVDGKGAARVAQRIVDEISSFRPLGRKAARDISRGTAISWDLLSG